MDLLIIRHAIATERDAHSGADDDARPLTDEGRKKMRRVAQGLRTIVPKIAVLASSPLVRARETAEIVADAYGGLPVEAVPALRPATPPAALADWLNHRETDEVVAVVGHEPHLSTTVGWLLSGTPRSLIELKKGAACVLAADQTWGPGTAILRWALSPGQLRALRD